METSNLVVFGIFEIIYLVTVFFFYISSKTTKTRIATSVLMGLGIAALAYNFVPKDGYDLIRHQQIARSFEGVRSFSDFNRKVVSYYEYVSQLYMLLIAKIGNYNFLQSIAALVGYSSLFFILIDYRSRILISDTKFIFLLLLVIFGQHIIHYFSGVFNYVAIDLFALGVYLEYYKQRKIIPWLIYVFTLLIHKSMFFPFIVLCVYKLKKGKLNFRFWIIYSIILLFINLLLNTIVPLLNIKYLMQTKQAFDYYSENNSSDIMVAWYGGMYLVMSVIKVAIFLISYIVLAKSKKKTTNAELSLLLCVSMIILTVFVPSLMRFSSLVLFVSIPTIMSAVGKNNSISRMLSFLMVLSSVMFCVYSITVLVPRLGIQ